MPREPCEKALWSPDPIPYLISPRCQHGDVTVSVFDCTEDHVKILKTCFDFNKIKVSLPALNPTPDPTRSRCPSLPLTLHQTQHDRGAPAPDPRTDVDGVSHGTSGGSQGTLCAIMGRGQTSREWQEVVEGGERAHMEGTPAGFQPRSSLKWASSG